MMLRLAKDHDRLTVVDDQVGRPTWTRTLAEFMTYLVDHHCEYGVYQLSNEDSCSWYEFACEISKRVPRIYVKDGKEVSELTFFE